MAGQPIDPLPDKQAVALLEILVNHFNESELKELCFTLGVDDETLPNDTKRDFARGLIQNFERRNEVAKLIAAGKNVRPQADWAAVNMPPNSAAQLSQSTTIPIVSAGSRFPPTITLLAKIIGGVGGVLGGLGGLAAFLSWLWPTPAAPPTFVPTPVASVIAAVTPTNNNLEFKVEQLHKEFSQNNDLPPQDEKPLIIPLQLETKGFVKPRTTDNFVWVLACQLDDDSIREACRGARLRLADNGVWNEVINVFNGPDECHRFEMKLWLVNGINDQELVNLAGGRFTLKQLDKVQATAPYAQIVLIGINKDNEEIDCSTSAKTNSTGLRLSLRR